MAAIINEKLKSNFLRPNLEIKTGEITAAKTKAKPTKIVPILGLIPVYSKMVDE